MMDFAQLISSDILAQALFVVFLVETLKRRFPKGSAAHWRPLVFWLSLGTSLIEHVATGSTWSETWRRGVLVAVVAFGCYEVGGIRLVKQLIHERVKSFGITGPKDH